MDQRSQNKNQSTNFDSPILQQALRKTNRTAAHDQGFALVAALCLMPLLMGSLFSALAIVWFLNTKNDLLFECESGLLKTQQTLISAENKLLLLNTPVKALVVQKKVLQKALRMAKNPALFAALKAQLLQIEVQLHALQKQQLVEIQKAHYQSQTQIAFLAQHLRRKLFHLQEQWSSRLVTVVKTPRPWIQLEAKKIDPSAILYIATTDFAQKQTLTLDWKLTGSHLFPTWLTFIYGNGFAWQDSCSSRPHKKEFSPWIAEIGKAVL